MWRKRCGKCGQAVAVFMAAFLFAYNGSLMASQPVGPVNIEFIPANPTSTTPITVHVWGDWSDACVPQFAGFEILGHEIHLYFQGPNPGTICAQVITPWDASVPIGSLAPGNYLVSVLYCEPDPIEGLCIYTSLAEAELRVIPEGADIEASVTALYGSDPRPIVLFGEPAEVGEVVQAELDYGDGTSTAPFRDPLPDHPICAASGGFRNSDKTVISRLGISAGAGRDVLLVVDIAGSTGFQPGSAGYIRILNPEWRIVGVVAGDPRLNTDYAGFGVRIDPDQGYVEWYGRGGCPACACHENGMNFVLVLRRCPVLRENVVLLFAEKDVYMALYDRVWRYVNDVESAFPDTSIIVEAISNRSISANELRQRILGYWQSLGKRLQGVIFLGRLPYAMWEFPFGDPCPLPFYYEDLDGEFHDQDGDGLLDFHEWGEVDAPQIWSAYMPGFGEDVIGSLADYLDKLHAYYEGSFPFNTVHAKALLYAADVWGSTPNCMQQQYLAMTESFTVERICGNTSSTDYRARLESAPWAFCYVLSHTTPHSGGHQFDTDNFYSADAVNLSSATGPVLILILGCHAGDFVDGENRCIAQAYPFGSSMCLASVGAVRSIGIEYELDFLRDLGRKPVGEAFKGWLDTVYDQSLIETRFPNDDINRFVWDYILYGDPFVELSMCTPMCELLEPGGWHMVVLPGELCPPCVYDTCGDLECAICDDLNPCFIFYYDPDQGSYVMAPPPENICYHAGMGFWVWTYEPDVQVCVDVEVPTEDVTVPLAAAWNMIGNPFPFDVAISALRVRHNGQELPLLEAQAQGWVSAYLFGYDSANGGYVMLDPEEGILEAWHGYWLRAYVECELLIPPERCMEAAPAVALSPQALAEGGMDLLPPPPPSLPELAGQIQVVPIPNPVRDVHTTTFRVLGICPCRVQALRVEIYDLAGKLVWQGEVEGPMLAWHTENLEGLPLANGVYLYKAYVKVENEWVPVGVQKVAVYR